MISLKSLLKPRNGHVVSSRDYAAAIEQCEADASAARREIEKLNESETAFVIENDLSGLDEIVRKRQVQELIIKNKVDVELPLLRERLAGALLLERQARVEFHFAKNRAAFEKLDRALSVACTANAEARAVYDAAAAELGGNDAARLIQPLHFGGLLLPDSVETWRAYMRTALDPSRQHRVVATPVVAKSPAARPNGHDGIKTGLGLLQHAVRLHDGPTPPPKKQRELFNETAGDGEQRIRIIRTGYETPGGKQCREGDVVAIPSDIARRAVENGAGEFAE